MTRIYGTFGPSCTEQRILSDMLRAGMTGIRVNLSHTMLTDASESIHALRAAEQETGIPSELLIDLQGPEVRIGALSAPLELTEGAEVTLGEDIPLAKAVLEALEPGQQLLLDDGKLLLEMQTSRNAIVRRGGILTSRKSLAIIGLELQLPALTAEDRTNLRHAAAFGVTGVMQPFVRGAEDLIALRNALDSSGGQNIQIMAKIENQSGIDNLQALLPYCDEIIIARGDLGNAVTLTGLPAAQKEIAAVCRAANKPFLVVTQLLASMEYAPVPTRAEVSDIFNAVLDGASSLMLTGETAVGKHPIEAIRWLKTVSESAEKFRNDQ